MKEKIDHQRNEGEDHQRKPSMRKLLLRKERSIVRNKTHNRAREKICLANQEKFHKECNQQYWKAIAEITSHEVASVKRRGKKAEERRPRQWSYRDHGLGNRLIFPKCGNCF